MPRQIDRREFLRICGVLGLSALTGSMPAIKEEWIENLSEDKYDFTDTFKQEMLDSAYVLRTEIPYLITESRGGKIIEKEDKCEWRGLGFPKGNKLLTAEHVLNKETTTDLIAENLCKENRWDSIEKRERHIYLADGTEIEPIYEDPEHDVAVLEIPDRYKRDCVLGDSDGLKFGEPVAVPSYSFGLKRGLKVGRVYATEGIPENVAKKICNYRKIANVDPEDIFIIQDLIVEGDSGGPVYFFRNGRPEVMGMSKVYFPNLGFVHKINDIKHLLRKYI